MLPLTMTPFQRLLQRFHEILGWEWRAHRALWIAVLLGVPAAAAVWGWTTDALAPRLLDAAILLECLFGLAAFLARNALARTLPDDAPEADALMTLSIVIAGVFSTVTGFTVFLKNIL